MIFRKCKKENEEIEDKVNRKINEFKNKDSLGKFDDVGKIVAIIIAIILLLSSGIIKFGSMDNIVDMFDKAPEAIQEIENSTEWED